MLRLAGPDVQHIFLTLPNTGDVKDYRKAVDALNAYPLRSQSRHHVC